MFIHPVLTWGFFLALVPLLIHLINLVRRRRVRWAAMDFLLQSYKKHQKWIWLQQMLLLALRILAVVAIVAMLAQWVARSQWLALFGGQVTHHYVLLDDSFSMSERLGGASAFDRARQVLSRMAAQSIAQESPQKMTLIRFSRALGFRKDDVSTEIGQLADLNAEPIDARFDALLEERQRGIEVTQLGVGSRPAWALALELLRQSPDETNIVHVLSDFRHKEWGNPTELKQLIGEVDRITNQIQFVHCAPEKQQSNLAIVDLRPANDIRAAGVPMRMTLTVANHGTETARRVPVRVRTTFYDPQVEAASAAGRLKGQVEEPPAVLIEELAPGQTTTRNVQVFFPSAGEHVVEASLPDDVVGVDNRRWCVVPVENRESILVVDGDAEQRNLFFLSAAFEPGPRAPTGVRVDGQPPAFLRDAAPAALDAYHAIYLLNVPTLDDRAIENLESFVRRGGGLAVFAGADVQLSHYSTRLYRNGDGLLPIPFDRDQLLPPDSEENVPDVEVVDHPLFSVLLGDRNTLLRLVNVDRYLAPRVGWTPPANSTVAVLARLRNRQPLVVEHRFGEGRVVAFLTTLAPQWNNWASNPSFVVVMLKLQSYLAAPRRPVDSRTAGTSVSWALDPTVYRKDVVLSAPGQTPEMPLIVQRSATGPAASQDGDAPAIATVSLPGTSTDDVNASRSGVYEAWLATIAGGNEVRRVAVNVDAAESDITQANTATLLTSLSPAKLRLRRADDFAFELTQEAGFYRGTWILLLLVALLLGEQLLAYAASYHPATAKGGARA